MLQLQGFTFVILMFIAWQDFKFRAVYWWLFVVLLVALAALKMLQSSLQLVLTDLSYNIAFLAAQFLFLTIYFSVKKRKLMNVFEEHLGLGDLFFLLSITVYFSFFTYVEYYLISLFMVTLMSVLLRFFVKRFNPTIPLAGWQALLLVGFMLIDTMNTKINLTADSGLINYFGWAWN